jgi:Ni,Fe-hydrogenase III large subunit
MSESSDALDPNALRERVLDALRRGGRFCGLFGSAAPGGTQLLAVVAHEGAFRTTTMNVPAGLSSYPALTPSIAAAAWYEREIHDLFGLEPAGHPRLDPLVLPLADGAAHPRPGSHGNASPRAPSPLAPSPLAPSPRAPGLVQLDTTPLPAHLHGEGVFTLPYGPVRSGVFESIEYLLETPGEYLPHVRSRVYYKHRGIEVRFEGMDVADGVLLAERFEGTASVAHAIAFSRAIERLAGMTASEEAELVRIIHAELERVAAHLDTFIRQVEAAGQAVAYSRLTLHKERVQRLRARLCGSRFGRGVVIPGGVAGAPSLQRSDLVAITGKIESAATADLRLLMATPSFVDRLRGTGVVPEEVARRHGAVGPVGRGSGQTVDVRASHPYGAYGLLGYEPVEPSDEGDVLARQRVRLQEIAGAFRLIEGAALRLDRVAGSGRWRVPLEAGVSGEALGWAESPQGEILSLVRAEEGHLVRVKPRSASFHNLALFATAFPRDIFTDFAFIEASFGLSVAGVAG